MGFSVPAAIGACIALKNTKRPVVSINGDGGFQMNMQELTTAVANKLPIKFIIINNSFLGMVRQWQELFHHEKYSFTDLGDSNPDFVKLGEAFGLESYSTDNPKEVRKMLEWAFSVNDRPVLLEFKVVKDDMVFPMVPAGASNSEMLLKQLNPENLL